MRTTLLALTGFAAFTFATSASAAVITLQDYETATAEMIGKNTQEFLREPGLSGSVDDIINDADSKTEIAAGGVFDSTQSALVTLAPKAGAKAASRFLSNSGGNSAINLGGPVGYVGYYYKLDATYADAQVKLAITLDNPGGVDLDSSVKIDAIADGSWHLVQWQLSDADQWETFAFTSSYGDGEILGNTVKVDSLYFGSEVVDRTFSIQVDDISYNADGMLADVPEPASLALLGLGSLACLRRRK